MDDKIILQMSGITKEFPGVKALDEVEFELKKGEVHALVGENGAGKSTFIKILTGAFEKDAGEIILRGEKVEIEDPSHAMSLGIGCIYQEFNLATNLTVGENVFLGREPVFGPVNSVKWEKLFSETQKYIDMLNVEIDPRDKVYELGVAEKQMVEIIKALSVEAEILIMDEPTAALTESETEKLFKAVKSLREHNVSIIFISHRLEEVEEIGDRATVFRDGKYTGTVVVPENLDEERREELEDKIIEKMVGRSLEDRYPKIQCKIGKEILRVENLSTEDKLDDISLNLREGEILGLAGLVGAGRTEVARAIFGADPVEKGDIYISGQKVNIDSPADAIRNGIGFITEDRKEQGLVLDLSVCHNLTLADLDKVSLYKKVINHKKERNQAQEYVSNLGIKTPGIEQYAKFLSGGNQQKLVLAKWMFTSSKIFIFDEPTRGIDVGSKIEVYNLMSDLVSNGVGIIMISSEMPEILALSDRIMVLSEGKKTGEFKRDEVNQQKIMKCATMKR